MGITDLSGDRKADEKYIENLVADGVYGAEADITIHMKHNPIFDAPAKPADSNKPSKGPLESYKMVFLDNTEY